ncbi:hypothetical protein RRG08_032205 [Elysia crispata]|uniref:Uncharacterized protein n=1 Tax=Elysia crispata TaxID=231223 RepID=A0AAE1ADM6_9GAST|nr:hypothetical protein RRG08_032205 [Elysia crispata]
MRAELAVNAAQELNIPLFGAHSLVMRRYGLTGTMAATIFIYTIWENQYGHGRLQKKDNSRGIYRKLAHLLLEKHLRVCVFL